MGRIDFSKYGVKKETTTPTPKTGGRIDFSKYQQLKPIIQQPQPIQRQPIQVTEPIKPTVGKVVKELPTAAKKVGKGIFKGITDLLVGGAKKFGQTLGEIAFTQTPEYKNMLKYISEGKMSKDEISKVAPVFDKSTAQILGEAGETVLDIATLGVGGQVVKAGAKLGIKALAKQGAKVGAKIGAGYGLTTGLQEKETTVGRIATSTAMGAGMGTLAGGILTPLLSKLGIKIGGKKVPKIAEKVTTKAETAEQVWLKEFRESARKTTLAEKTPNRPFTLEEIKLEEKDWKAFSKSKGYTEKEINDFQRYLDLEKEGRKFGYNEDDTFGIVKEVESTLKLETTPMGKITPQPFAPTSRVNQFSQYLQDTVRKIERSPDYLKKLSESGGGRTITHIETYKKAITTFGNFDDEVNKIANWKQGKPVSEVDVSKAQLVNQFLNDSIINSSKSGDTKMWQSTIDTLAKMEAGFQNLTATPGRATEIQKVAVYGQVKETAAKVGRLLKKGATFTEMRKELSSDLKLLKGFSKTAAYGMEAIRSVENYASGAKLTSLVTHAVNTISNSLTSIQRGVEKNVRATQQLVKGKPYEALQTAKYSFGRGIGFKSGAQKFLKTLVEDTPDLVKSEIGKTPLLSRLTAKLPKPIQITGRILSPFRWLGAADNFWKGIIKDSEIAIRAHTEGRGNPEKITNFLNNPPQEWIDDAMKIAKDYTFQMDADKILKGIMTLRNVPGGRIIVPFVKTPYNIIKFQLQRSVLGVFSPRNLQDIAGRTSDLLTERIAKREEAISRLLVGSALSLAGYYVAEHGEITGAYPKDPAERALWQAENKKPYTIRIGNKQIQYNRFQPVGLYLSQAAAIKSLVDSGDWKQVDSSASRFVFETTNMILDMPFVQGVSQMFDALNDPQRSAQQFLNSAVVGFIPNVLRDIRQQTDIKQRQVKTLMENIMNMLPGQSQKLPEKVDILGNILQYSSNRIERFSKVITTITENQATKILRDAKYSPTLPDATLEVSLGPKKKSVELTGKDKERFLKEMGAITNQAIIQTAKSSTYQKSTTDIKQYLLKLVIEKYRQAIRDKWKKEYLK